MKKVRDQLLSTTISLISPFQDILKDKKKSRAIQEHHGQVATLLLQHIFYWNTTEKRKMCLPGAWVWASKQVQQSPKEPEYIIA